VGGRSLAFNQRLGLGLGLGTLKGQVRGHLPRVEQRVAAHSFSVARGHWAIAAQAESVFFCRFTQSFAFFSVVFVAAEREVAIVVTVVLLADGFVLLKAAQAVISVALKAAEIFTSTRRVKIIAVVL
jgi:hypothetical protein